MCSSGLYECTWFAPCFPAAGSIRMKAGPVNDTRPSLHGFHIWQSKEGNIRRTRIDTAIKTAGYRSSLGEARRAVYFLHTVSRINVVIEVFC